MMLPAKAITTHVKRTLDADTPVPTDMPLYAIRFSDGSYGIIDPKAIADLPCPTLTPEGLDEIQNPDRLPMDALPHIQIWLSEQPGQFVTEGLQRAGIDTAWLDE